MRHLGSSNTYRSLISPRPVCLRRSLHARRLAPQSRDERPPTASLDTHRRRTGLRRTPRGRIWRPGARRPLRIPALLPKTRSRENVVAGRFIVVCLRIGYRRSHLVRAITHSSGSREIPDTHAHRSSCPIPCRKIVVLIMSMHLHPIDG